MENGQRNSLALPGDKAARPLRALVHEGDLHIEALHKDRADNFCLTFLRIKHEHAARQWRGRVQLRRHKRQANGPSQHGTPTHLHAVLAHWQRRGNHNFRPNRIRGRITFC
jgi:hypothetical protein